MTPHWRKEGTSRNGALDDVFCHFAQLEWPGKPPRKNNKNYMPEDPIGKREYTNPPSVKPRSCVEPEIFGA